MPKQRGYLINCRSVLLGTYFTVAIFAILSTIGLALNHGRTLIWLAMCGVAFLCVSGTLKFVRRDHCHAAHLLVLLYTLLAGGFLWDWGISIPVSTILFGLVIVLSGVLLSSRHAFFATAIGCFLLVGLQAAAYAEWPKAATSWGGQTSSFGDVVAYCLIFGMLALIAWLYNREIAQVSAQTEKAKATLRQQKATLEAQVEKRTAQLQQIQLKELQQIYRFAELGQLGVTLLHDLANHLTALTLEIEGLQEGQHTKEVARSREIIKYLDGIVDTARERLHGSTKKQSFNIIEKTNETIEFLRYKAKKADVIINWHPPTRSWKYTGDPASFCQIITILTNNAIDAYGVSGQKPLRAARLVVVAMRRTDTDIIIKVSNAGDEITKSQRKNLFKPFHSSKKSGLGIGLFIAKQAVEVNFSGTITLNPHSDTTEFVIKLPAGPLDSKPKRMLPAT